jgi:pilus assembly protein Flp/PilA
MKIYKLFKNVKGATAIEYGLIAALVAVAAISAMTYLGTSVKGTFNRAGASMTAAIN